ncbi:MAG: J domain-containing protein [Actinobacteria bacterium]|nr:J domain-containing protein [Actinomycetota bacterium]
MLLAELEVWHSRLTTPTRRIALGHLVLPVDPTPGFGGLLLGAVIAKHIADVDEDLVPDIHRLLAQVERGTRIVQPRLRHRYQVDRHGLAVSVHRLLGEGDNVRFDLHTLGTPLSQVLGAIYALERLDESARHHLVPVLHRAMRWRGQIGPSFVANLAGTAGSSLAAMADPRAWALDLLGFPQGTSTITKKEITARYRDGLRRVHPDHGGDRSGASKAIADLGEARRILSQ